MSFGFFEMTQTAYDHSFVPGQLRDGKTFPAECRICPRKMDFGDATQNDEHYMLPLENIIGDPDLTVLLANFINTSHRWIRTSLMTLPCQLLISLLTQISSTTQLSP